MSDPLVWPGIVSGRTSSLTVPASSVRKRSRSMHATGVSYDAVVLNAVLEHVSDPDSMIASAAQLTRSGGLLYVDVSERAQSGDDPQELTQPAATLRDRLQPLPRTTYSGSARRRCELSDKHGFQVTNVRVWAAPSIPASGGVGDHIAAVGASQIARIANRTGKAANMLTWARNK